MRRLSRLWGQRSRVWCSLGARGYQWKTGAYGQAVGRRAPPESPVAEVGDELGRFLSAYRAHGHRKADVNPVALHGAEDVPELDISRFVSNTDKRLTTSRFLGGSSFTGTIGEAEQELSRVYANRVGVECAHLENEAERLWIQNRWERLALEEVPEHVKREAAVELIKSQVLDSFLAIKFVSLKRYGCEGAETQITFLQEFFRSAGAEEVVIAAHHRGRLNVMINLLNMPAELLFRKLRGKSEFPDEVKTNGDVISHLCPSTVLSVAGRPVHVQMTNSPSHLEAVCPVSLGQTRALQQILLDGDYATSDPTTRVANLQIHGDASFAGQGVSHESLLTSLLPNFNVCGTVHLIVNNQLGFTTPPLGGRGTRYATDLAKVISAPVLHVNGEYPEDVIRATRLACEYRSHFRKNVFVDLNCYRKRGHNELDDPTFTNPLQYKIINSRTSIPDLYADQMMQSGLMSTADVENVKTEYYAQLSTALENCAGFVPPAPERKYWSGYSLAPHALTTWDTGVGKELLQLVGHRSVAVPEGFLVHPNIVKSHVNARKQRLTSDGRVDWSTAEALAFGSLLYEGYNVRLSGQDVGRGTFSHRHAMLVDQNSDDVYVPLDHIAEGQIGRFEVVNSLLSEEAVLGFEYGFSTVSPTTLVIWEAQFGDFFNGAQIQIDTYISSGEAKWATTSGLTMLLPHGYDGAGPEHSSCRLERFLQMTDSSEVRPDGEDINFHVVNPTNPAQYFHLIRRQMVRNYRKPLVVVAPKTLIRSPDALSRLDDLSPGTAFQPVLDDPTADPNKVKRLVFTSGKHFYALHNHKVEHNLTNVAIIRLEELAPFPTHQLRTVIARYKSADQFVWSQEEPRNMGCWTFCSSRFHNLVGRSLRYVGRDVASCPATGIGEIHKQEAQMVVESPFK